MYDAKLRKRLAVKKGIMFIRQICGRNEFGFEEWMKMDAEYVYQWSLKMDMEI
jgi:lipopolysaccharide/colanic/teichoic acid biosynthesis glycosyltransferase